ncbi:MULTISPECIES: OmpW/AlkL family protein [Sphingomonas]|uniref:OmpW/AlkL family protein n=1 Tax=Sphingomonas TaxID=13687 RepID=UPI0008354D5D|nr:OmpW family outer membrane protein [Sphingomonas sp. CCH10-B3]MBA3878911.1 OmpW family protein [Sphingobium sp.]
MKHKVPMVALAAMAVIAAAPAAAREGEGLKAHDVLLRVRGIWVAPNGTSDGILPTLPGDRLRIGDSFAPEIDVTWMATDHIGFELIAATTKHSAHGKAGVTAGLGRVVETWVLPPTLTAQYHFNSKGKVRPYLGAGINYTVFWNEKATPELTSAVGPTRVHINDSVGYALQGGVDIDISKRFFLNLDAKYIDMSPRATIYTTALGTQTVRTRISPIIVGVGIGMRL